MACMAFELALLFEEHDVSTKSTTDNLGMVAMLSIMDGSQTLATTFKLVSSGNTA